MRATYSDFYQIVANEDGTPVGSVQITSTTATHTSVNSSNSPVSILAANTARQGASLYNESTAVAYVKLGTGVSVTSYWRQLAAGAYVEIPFAYEGAIEAVWAAVNGAMRVVEFT